MEILISSFHPNDSRGNVCFPVVFRSRAIKSRGNMKDRLPKSRATITVRKKVESRVSRVHGIAKREQHVRIHMFVDGGDGIGPLSGLRYIAVCSLCRYFGIFRLACTYCYHVLFSKRWVLCLSGCIVGFLPKRSRLPAAQCRRFGSGIMYQAIRVFGLLGFCRCCCSVPTRMIR